MNDLTLQRVWTKEGVSIAEIVKTSGATEFMLGYGPFHPAFGLGAVGAAGNGFERPLLT